MTTQPKFLLALPFAAVSALICAGCVPAAKQVTWTCVSDESEQCPWGPTLTGYAAIWPGSSNPSNIQLGYVASDPVYLPAGKANGTTVQAASGKATVYAQVPSSRNSRVLANLQAGDSFDVRGLYSTEVLSVEDEAAFTFQTTPTNGPPLPDPNSGIQGLLARWCTGTNASGCADGAWTGAVISWPAGTAYSTNGRSGQNGRTVWSDPGDARYYPYMGSWAEGCKVTAVDGITVIIEWQRGTETWRETTLYPGESHTIHLVPPENGAMIEGIEQSPGFAVKLESCYPQFVPFSF